MLMLRQRVVLSPMYQCKRLKRCSDIMPETTGGVYKVAKLREECLVRAEEGQEFVCISIDATLKRCA
jgi:hypothetical protein